MNPHMRGVGWCQNLMHPDHLHPLNRECSLPTTLEHRLSEMRSLARDAGNLEKLDEKINHLRSQATRRAFDAIVGSSDTVVEEEQD